MKLGSNDNPHMIWSYPQGLPCWRLGPMGHARSEGVRAHDRQYGARAVGSLKIFLSPVANPSTGTSGYGKHSNFFGINSVPTFYAGGRGYHKCYGTPLLSLQVPRTTPHSPQIPKRLAEKNMAKWASLLPSSTIANAGGRVGTHKAKTPLKQSG